MYIISSQTLFLGKNLIFLPECQSTNTTLRELGQKKDLAEGTVLITENQIAGRGQRGNVWEAEPGKNLTFSILLKPKFLEAKDQFYLNQVVSLSIYDTLAGDFGEDVRIKWPNDIVVKQKKICGILIENQTAGTAISLSVVGIGLNVNQEKFKIEKAASMKMLSGKEYHLNKVLEKIIEQFEARYLQLRGGQITSLQKDYLQVLYRRGEPHLFYAEGKTQKGTITGVDESGRLKVETAAGTRVFGLKEIAYLD